MGILSDGPAPPRVQWIGGILEYSRTPTTSGRSRTPRRLVLRHAMASPDKGILLEIYRPEIVDVSDKYLRIRGIEPIEMGSGLIGAMVQEWLVDMAGSTA